MLIALILVLLLVGSAVIGSIYSNFLVFYSNFRETENYHKAYYASISALERGELVTKQHEPGYIGSGGFKMGIGTGSVDNTTGSSDGSLSDFSYFGTNSGESTVFWTVNSRTKRIPAIGEGDVEEMFVTGDSKNYNMMDYENAEVFLLYYDDSKEPYTGKNIKKTFWPTVGFLTGIIRLPQAITGMFGVDLDKDTSLVGLSGSLPKNDAIVDWQFRGTVTVSSLVFPFTVYSTQSLEYNGNETKVNEKEDSVFREGDVNSPLKFRFGNNRNPFYMGGSRGTDVEPTIISRNEDAVRGMESFSRLFYQANTPQLRFSLLNLLESREDGYGKKHIYPFLEYYVDFGSRYASNVYYKIEAEGNYKDYQVNNVIYKPTVKDTILGSFTSIF